MSTTAKRCIYTGQRVADTLAEALEQAGRSLDDWHANHQGELLSIEAFVWECGDDCHCSEAQIVAWYRNKVASRFCVPRQLWAGEFRTDGSFLDSVADLSAKRQQAEAAEPALAALIAWPA